MLYVMVCYLYVINSAVRCPSFPHHYHHLHHHHQSSISVINHPINIIVMSSSSISDAITVQSLQDLHTDLSLSTCERAYGILDREGISTFSLLSLFTEERLEKLLIPAGVIAVLAAKEKLLKTSAQQTETSSSQQIGRIMNQYRSFNVSLALYLTQQMPEHLEQR